MNKAKLFLSVNFILLSIIFISAIMRIHGISRNPPGLYWDEASNGYNAYSILKSGKDEYGKLFPLTFRAYNDFRPGFYIYSIVPSLAIFGLNEFAVRFPSALSGIISVFLTYLIVIKLFQNKKIALLSSALLAVSPWHIQFSRGGFEANEMVFLCLLGLVLFLYSKKNQITLILSAITFGLALNTYHGAKIWVPLFVLITVFWYKDIIFKSTKRYIIPLFILALMTSPFIIDLQSTAIRGQSVNYFGKVENPQDTFISNFLSHFSPNFLFNTGDPTGRHSTPGMGELYVFELPLILIGLYKLLKNSNRESKFLLTWLIAAPIPAALATPTPHALRAITFLPVWAIIASVGLSSLLKLSFSKNIKTALLLTLLSIAAYNFVTYFHLYYKHYPKLKAPDWQDGYREMLVYVNEVKDQYATVAISNYYGQSYIYTLFYLKYNPRLYLSERREDKSKFGKFEFFGSSWEKTKPGKALVITPQWQAHPTKVLKDIYSINGDLVYRISETE